jgi:1-acyl-sn-glycerol-3-phosphate acyltransferase
MNQNQAVACSRDPLVDAIATFLARDHALGLSEIRASLARTIDDAGATAIDGLGKRLASVGSDWSYYPRDPLARDIHRVLAGRVLQHDPVVHGIDHLDRVRGQRVVIVANHLSYSDANAIDVLLQRSGGAELADRMTVVAGPKVYTNLRRRFSSLCFGTIKVPQTSARSSDEAVMTPREVALAARRSIEVAHERLRLGEALLVFAEGTRSRTGQVQRLLPGAARYLELPDTWVLPMGIVGTERLFPMSEDSINPVRIILTIGRPRPARLLDERAKGDRQLVMDEIGRAIAALLPPEYRGAYGDAVDGRYSSRPGG